MKNKFFSIVLSVILMLTTAAFAHDTITDMEAANRDPATVYEETGNYIESLGVPEVGSVGGEWMVIALTRGGRKCPDGYYENVLSYVNENINDKNQLHRVKSTDNSRVILALTAAGYDVTDVNGHNLLYGLSDMTYIKKQGINGPVWALIAFDAHNYEIPKNENEEAQATREGIISHILEKQLDDGGWSLFGKAADPDLTGMAIQSLAPYYDTHTQVQEAVDNALDCLSAMQHENGSFGSVDGVCSESCAQVAVALTALSIDPEADERFIKNGVSVIDALCSFAVDGGGFEHMPYSGLNGMATEQGQYALVSYFRFLEGKSALYDMTDVEINGGEASDEGGSDNYGSIGTGVYEDTFDYSEAEDITLTESDADKGEDFGLTDKHADVKKMSVVASDKTFDDVAAHDEKAKIEALASRGIINGKTDNSFEPNSTMTRAEFAAVIARGLGLPEKSNAIFEDIKSNDWYYNHVSTAYDYGIIKGVSENEFNPNGTITREEAAVMITRAARLCGINTETDAEAARKFLAHFFDYFTVSDWSQNALCFCYKQRILPNNTMVIMPKEAVTRAEIADMLYNMLFLAKLL